jgi:hypothetical protein
MMPSVERLRFNATVNKALELSAELPPIAGNPEIWLSAHLVACTLFPKLKGSMTSTIFKRSRGGLLRARAQSIIIEDRPWREDAIVPIQFWSSDDPKDENCNWTTGDFETRVDSAVIQAFGVAFYRPDLEASFPMAKFDPAEAMPFAILPSRSTKGGRPPADHWDELWVEICRQIYTGELVPKRQSDVLKAMQQWCSDHGHSDAPSTLKPRAHRLWNVVFSDEKKT